MPSQNTRGRRRRTVEPQESTAAALRAVAATLVSKAADTLSRPKFEEIDQPRSTARSGHQQGNRRRNLKNRISIREDRRTELPFGQEGDLEKVFESLPDLKHDSPGAAFAICYVLANSTQQHTTETERAQERAGNTLTDLLMIYRPTPASLANADVRRKEAQASTSPQGLLTGEMKWWEQQLLLHAHSDQSQTSLNQVAKEMISIADRFEQVDSHRRQACARAMAAYCYLRIGKHDEAKEQIVRAFALIGMVYHNDALFQLAEAADRSLVERTIGSQSQQQHAYAEASSSEPFGSTTEDADSMRTSTDD